MAKRRYHDRRSTSATLSTAGRELLDRLCDRWGLTQAQLTEQAIRVLAARRLPPEIFAKLERQATAESSIP